MICGANFWKADTSNWLKNTLLKIICSITHLQALAEKHWSIFFSRFSKPQNVADTIKSSVVAIVAEGDMVMLSFVREMTDPAEKSKRYTTTWFDLFRIENGKIAEHWDCAQK